MSAHHCPEGARRIAQVTRADADLQAIARKATRGGIAGERAQRLVPQRKAERDSQREQLAEHEAACTECIEATR